MKKLDILRKRIRKIDENLVELINERLKTALEIGKLKKSFGLPLKNRKVEKDVIERGKRRASKFGISTQLVVDILQKLIKESCVVQELNYFMDDSDLKEKIFIIGANGNMGQWFSEFFRIKGHKVYLYDIQVDKKDNFWVDFNTGIENSSIILIATPIEQTGEIIERISNLNYRGVVFDIAGIKSPILKSYERAKRRGLSITSLHPMFGPGAKILSDKIICICDVGDKKANKRVRDLFEKSVAKIIELPVEEHDRIISYILNLSYIINIIFINILSNSGFSYNELVDMGNTTFFSQIKTSKRVINENPELYFNTQKLNINKNEISEELLLNTEKLVIAIKNDDLDLLKKITEQGRKWIQE